MNTKSEDDRESMRKLLPILAGKVQAVVAAKGRWTDKDLSSRTIQFGPTSFTYRDVVAFSEIFKLVDTDGSGQISAHEVRHLMKLLGETVELSEVEALIQDFDLDGSGEVDLTEFILVLAMQRKSDYKRADVLRAFDLFAKPTQTRRGTVNKDVLRQALLDYGTSAASEKEISKLVDTLPTADEAGANEFDYLKHINMFMG